MSESPKNDNRAFILAGFLLLPVVFLCVQFLDVPISLFVRDRLYASPQWSQMTSTLPDLLLVVVVCSMLVSLVVYLVRSRRGMYDAATMFAWLVLWAAPASYLAKMVLKIVFGRVNTRFWLQHPALYGFHWFEMREGCEGFPSGHMLVLVTLFSALLRFYPRYRTICVSASLILGVALIATNYHFLSDVLSGAYLGVAVELVAVRLLFKGQEGCRS